MAERKPQTLENHPRLVPGFHLATSLCLALNWIWAVAHLVRHLSLAAGAYLLLSSGALMLFHYTRQFATGNQDRIIRLEETLRLQRLASDVEGDEFTIDQLIALRFASDRELPDLARRVLAENLTSRKQIKRLIKEWRGDYQRV